MTTAENIHLKQRAVIADRKEHYGHFLDHRPTRVMVRELGKDKDVLNQCLRLLRENRLLLFSTNNRGFRLYDEHLDTDRIKGVTRQTTGFDFDAKLDRLCFELRPGARPKKN